MTDGGTFAETQSVAAGIVAGVTVAGNRTTPKPGEPPNSPATTARFEPGATARPFVPKLRLTKSGEKSWTFVGADQVPGDPGVKVTPDKFTKASFWMAGVGVHTLPAQDSTDATATPVLQSSALASSSNPANGEGDGALYTAPDVVLTIWNSAPSNRIVLPPADRISFLTGSTEISSLVLMPNRPIGAPNVLLPGLYGSSWPALLELPSAIHALPVAASMATPHVSHEPPEKD